MMYQRANIRYVPGVHYRAAWDAEVVETKAPRSMAEELRIAFPRMSKGAAASLVRLLAAPNYTLGSMKIADCHNVRREYVRQWRVAKINVCYVRETESYRIAEDSIEHITSNLKRVRG